MLEHSTQNEDLFFLKLSDIKEGGGVRGGAQGGGGGWGEGWG